MMKRSIALLAGSATALTLLPVAAPTRAAAPKYTIQGIGTLRTDGTGGSKALALNDQGVVTGEADADAGAERGFVWNPIDGIQDFQTLGITLGGSSSTGWGINNSGDVVGDASTATAGHAFYKPAGGAVQDLNGLDTFAGGLNSRSTAVNNEGKAAGFAQDSEGVTRAFIYSGSELTDLGVLEDLGGTESRANGISNTGAVAGAANTGDGKTYGVVWKADGNPVAFYYFNSTSNEAFDVNDNGLAVGAGVVKGKTRPFRVDISDPNATFKPLSAAGKVTVARSINNAGVIVGWTGGTELAKQKACMWSAAGKRVDLNKVLPKKSGWVLRRAYGINESGQIVGEGTFQGNARGFVLTPPP